MTRVKILHFIDTLGAGGAERQLVYLLENIDRSHYDCHVLTTYDTFRHYEALLHQLDIPIHSLHHGELRFPNRTRAVARYVQLMRALRPQLMQSWLHYPNLIARVARPFCPAHCLITSIRTEYSPRQLFSERVTGWLSDFRIVNYPLKEKNNFKRNTTHIANAVPQIPSTNRTSTPFTAIMVARIDPRKDHITLLKALHILKPRLPTDFRLYLIGEITDPHTQAQIRSAISEYALSEVVEQLPPTYDIHAYYQACDITILPSKSEGFSNVILESFAAGKPILISEAANQAELVKLGTNGWVFPTGDSQALAAQLERAWQITEQERATMGENGRAIAEQYSIPRMVDQYTQLYERALRRS